MKAMTSRKMPLTTRNAPNSSATVSRVAPGQMSATMPSTMAVIAEAMTKPRSSASGEGAEVVDAMVLPAFQWGVQSLPPCLDVSLDACGLGP